VSSATSASEIHRCWSSSKTALVYLIVVHASSPIVVTALRTAAILAGGDREAAVLAQRGGDHLVAVERNARFFPRRAAIRAYCAAR